LRAESATTTVSHAVTVAAGVFAPGHLGGLTRYLPFELVDDVLEQTRRVPRRLRDLPSRVGVYFLLSPGMFPRLGYARVWDKGTTGLAGLAVPRPSEKALRDLRRRLGPAPMHALFEVVAGRWRGHSSNWPWRSVRQAGWAASARAGMDADARKHRPAVRGQPHGSPAGRGGVRGDDPLPAGARAAVAAPQG
jgi:hypothetical protein